MSHKRNIEWPRETSLAVDWTFNELAIRNPTKHSHLEYKNVAPSFFKVAQSVQTDLNTNYILIPLICSYRSLM